MEALCRGARAPPGRSGGAVLARRAAAAPRAAVAPLTPPRREVATRRAPRVARLRAPRAAGDGAVVGGASASAPAIGAATTATPLAPLVVDLRFDNSTDDNGTTVSLVGEDTAGLLAGVLAAFATLGVQVVTASITTKSGAVRDTFLVTGANGGKLPEDELERVRGVGRAGGGAGRAWGARAPRLSLDRKGRERTLPRTHWRRPLYLFLTRAPRAAPRARPPPRSGSTCWRRCAWARATAASR
jgi:hypothetical protein